MANPEATIQCQELPVEVLDVIFSFLPTVDDVRTTVLSRRLNRMWRTHQSLDFDSERDFRKILSGEAQFITFVNRVLYFRDPSQIYKFRLKLSRNRYVPIVAEWIRTAVMQDVLVLDLDISFRSWDREFELPECIFLCKTLRDLKLKLTPWVVTAAIPTSGCFPSLKFLHVTVLDPYEEEMRKLFSCCPILESLTIDGTIDGDNGNHANYSFKVYASELKRLRICLENILKPVDVHIYAPKLETLALKRLGLTNCFLVEGTESLVSASIAFREPFEIEGPLDLSTFAGELLQRVSNVKSLSLSVRCLDDLHLPAFGNMNQLKLVLWDLCCWDVLVWFLNSSPNLEDVVLENRTEGHKELSELQWNPPRDVPMYLSSVKTISLKGFKILPVEVEMIKYLLKNGDQLNMMKIYMCVQLSCDTLPDFIAFPRAPTCHLEFLQMQV
ncbi:hypothetical protein ABKV19_003763 [Rosa sericea]